MCMVIVFASRQWSNCTFKPSTATFARPIAGKSCLQAERCPQLAICTLQYGATWLMACMCLAGTRPVPAVAPVCRLAPVRRSAPQHSTAFLRRLPQRPCNSMIARRKEDGRWLVWRVCLERFLGFSLGGLLRYADLSMFEWISRRHENIWEKACHRSTHFGSHFLTFFCIFIFHSLLWIHMQGWRFVRNACANMVWISWWLQNVGAWFFIAALVVLQYGLLLEQTRDRGTGQLLFALSPWTLLFSEIEMK